MLGLDLEFWPLRSIERLHDWIELIHRRNLSRWLIQMATQNAWSSHGCFEPPTDFHLYTTFKCQANFQHICKTSNIKFTLLLAIGQQWGCTIWEDCYGLGHGVSARTLQLADAQVRMERGRRIRDEGFPLGNVWFTVHVLYTYYIHGQDIYFISIYIYNIHISRQAKLLF